MPLVNMKSMLKRAVRNDYGVGAFNTLSIEAVRGAIRAAEELEYPIILQLAQVQLDAAPMEYIAPVMVEAAHKASIPVAVHFDHGEDLDQIHRALDNGFTSVMFDGSSLDMKENMRMSMMVTQLAHRYDATSEAELGRVGGGEDGNYDIEMMLTDVEEVGQFIEETNVDALAVAIGNAHGPYMKRPNLQFDRLAEINHIAGDTPLVLHGGSGITREGFRQSITRGIRKINVATALQQSVVQRVRTMVNSNNPLDYFSMYSAIEDAVYNEVKNHINIFQNPPE